MKFRLSLILVIGLAYLAAFLYMDRWKTTLYYGDSSHYYLHVVSFFINDDVGDYDKTITSLRTVNPGSPDIREDIYGIRPTEKGRMYIKYTVGVPLFETPFFLLAHAYAKVSDKYEAHGWSRPYLLMVGLSSIFYILVGFYLLIGVLERFFSRRITALTVLSIALATNLLYQGTYVTMSHAFLFFLYCVLIRLTVSFYDRDNWRKALGIGLTVGLIALTRVPEIISALIPLLWGVTDGRSLRERVQFFIGKYQYLILAAAGFIVGFALQFAYWYYVSGKLYFNPYEGEGFNFLKPKIWKGLFAYTNGWLRYTPIMALAIAGIFMMKRRAHAVLWPLIAFVGLHYYVHYSYYAWTFFPGLGSRPMVEAYAILSFALASFYAFCYSRPWLKWLPVAALTVFGALNIFQTWQSNEGIIWSERGNRAFYWATFGKVQESPKAFRAYDTNERQPDMERVVEQKVLLRDGFEDAPASERDSTFVRDGEYSLLVKSEFSEWGHEIPLAGIEKGEWLRIAVDAYFTKANIPPHRDQCTQFVVQIFDGKGKLRRWRSMAITSHIGNDSGSIWVTGVPEMWDTAYFFLKVPGQIRDDWSMKVLVWNIGGQAVYLDNVRITRWSSSE